MDSLLCIFRIFYVSSKRLEEYLKEIVLSSCCSSALDSTRSLLVNFIYIPLSLNMKAKLFPFVVLVLAMLGSVLVGFPLSIAVLEGGGSLNSNAGASACGILAVSSSADVNSSVNRNVCGGLAVSSTDSVSVGFGSYVTVSSSGGERTKYVVVNDSGSSIGDVKYI